MTRKTSQSKAVEERITLALIAYRKDTDASSEGRLITLDRHRVTEMSMMISDMSALLRSPVATTIEDELVQIAKLDVQLASRVSTTLRLIAIKGGSADLALKALYLIRGYVDTTSTDAGYEAANHIRSSLLVPTQMRTPDEIVADLETERLEIAILERISDNAYGRGRETRRFNT